MGWDVILLNVPSGARTIARLPDGGVIPLGSREEVLAAIGRAFPELDLTDPSWLVLSSDAYAVEFSVGPNQSVDSLMLHVHGDSRAIAIVQRLCEAGKWRAFDTSAGEFIDFDSPNRDRGLRRWQEYRRQIRRQYERD